MQKRLSFIVAALVVFFFFVKVIPPYVIYDHEFLWGFIAGGIIAFLLYTGLKGDKEKMYTPEGHQAEKTKMNVAIIVSVFSVFITLFAVYFMNIPRGHAYIKEHSVLAKGRIIDGQAETTKRRGSSSTTYEIDVRFNADGQVYTESVDISSEEWSKVGKGMPVLVSYAKGHPKMCKVLFNAEDVKKYSSSTQVKDLTFENIRQLYRTKGDLSDKLEEVSLGWGKDETEKGNQYYYNSVFESVVVKTEDMLYLTQMNNADNFMKLLAEARKQMKPVYDSVSVNGKKGSLFKNDSLSIRFQQYTKMEKEDINNTSSEFSFSIPSYKYVKHYVIAIAKEGSLMLMPGDFEEDNENKTQTEMLREELLKGMNKDK